MTNTDGTTLIAARVQTVLQWIVTAGMLLLFLTFVWTEYDRFAPWLFLLGGVLVLPPLGRRFPAIAVLRNGWVRIAGALVLWLMGVIAFGLGKVSLSVHPEPPAVTHDQNLTLTGTVRGKSPTIQINDKSEPVDEGGSFKATVALQQGQNKIRIAYSALDHRDNVETGKKEFQIRYVDRVTYEKELREAAEKAKAAKSRAADERKRLEADKEKCRETVAGKGHMMLTPELAAKYCTSAAAAYFRESGPENIASRVPKTADKSDSPAPEAESAKLDRQKDQILKAYIETINSLGVGKFVASVGHDSEYHKCSVTIVVQDVWHYQPKQIRLQAAQNLWKLWSNKCYIETSQDMIRIKLVDGNGNKVGGSSYLGGSSIKVDD